MNAYELANELDETEPYVSKDQYVLTAAATMLRQQQAQIDKYKQVLESIANEQVELSHDKIKWQNEDHIMWAKGALQYITDLEQGLQASINLNRAYNEQ